MKRLFRVSMGVLAFILLMSMPALAAVDIGGQIFFDTYYYHQDKEGFSRPFYASSKTQPGSGGVAGIPKTQIVRFAEDRNQTYMDLNHATALRFHWTNQEGLGAFIVTYMNADPAQSSSTDPGFKVGVSVAVLYYDILKDLRLTVGRGGATQVFSPFDPTTYMGYDGICKVEALGYGNINSKYQDGIRLTYNPFSFVGLDLYLANPRLSQDTGPSAATAGWNELNGGIGIQGITIPGAIPALNYTLGVDNVSTVPKVELAMPLKYGGTWGRVVFTPSAMYLKQKFNNVAPGGDDSVESYGLAASGLVEIFGFKLMGEYNFGRNLYNASRIGESTVYPFKSEYIYGGLRNAMGARAYQGTSATYSGLKGKIYDADTNAFWIQLGYNIMNRVEPTVFYGRNYSRRTDMPMDNSPAVALGVDRYGDTSFTTQMYGINVPVTITKNFKVVPEFMVYDNGKENRINGVDYDFGKEWAAGVQFRVTF